jgi:hypothetical protein
MARRIVRVLLSIRNRIFAIPIATTKITKALVIPAPRSRIASHISAPKNNPMTTICLIFCTFSALSIFAMAR